MKQIAVLISVLIVANAQIPASRPQFEVATVKPNKSGGPGSRVGTDGPRRFGSENTPLSFLVQWAWGVRGFQIVGGPKWFSSDRFDIHAASENDATFEQSRLMLQTLLEDRFQLKVHREKRDQAVYILTQVKNGAKIQPLPPESCATPDSKPQPGEPSPKPCGSSWGPSKINGDALTMAVFASYLSDILKRPVIDKTSLSGSYEIHLAWTPDDSTPGPLGQSAPRSDEIGPSIFTAIQEQLGLRLESGRAPADVLVVDNAELPSEN